MQKLHAKAIKYIFELSKIVVSMLNNLKYKGLQRYDQKTAENTLLLSSQLSHSKLHQLISQQKIINFEKCEDENKNDKVQEYFFNCAGFDNAKMYIYERSDASCFMQWSLWQKRCTNLLKKLCPTRKLETGMKSDILDKFVFLVSIFTYYINNLMRNPDFYYVSKQILVRFLQKFDMHFLVDQIILSVANTPRALSSLACCIFCENLNKITLIPNKTLVHLDFAHKN